MTKINAFKTHYKNVDEIFKHARTMGYFPVIKENEIETHGYIEIDFYLRDGKTSPFSRTYDKLDDGRYQFVEESWSEWF